jgi:hypothetical protein
MFICDLNTDFTRRTGRITNEHTNSNSQGVADHSALMPEAPVTFEDVTNEKIRLPALSRWPHH